MNTDDTYFVEDGKCFKWIYTPYFKHWRTGKIVHHPEGGVFKFKIEVSCNSCG